MAMDVSQAYYQDDEAAEGEAGGNQQQAGDQQSVTLQIPQAQIQQAAKLAQQGSYDELGRLFASLLSGS